MELDALWLNAQSSSCVLHAAVEANSVLSITGFVNTLRSEELLYFPLTLTRQFHLLSALVLTFIVLHSYMVL